MVATWEPTPEFGGPLRRMVLRHPPYGEPMLTIELEGMEPTTGPISQEEAHHLPRHWAKLAIQGHGELRVG